MMAAFHGKRARQAALGAGRARLFLTLRNKKFEK